MASSRGLAARGRCFDEHEHRRKVSEFPAELLALDRACRPCWSNLHEQPSGTA